MENKLLKLTLSGLIIGNLIGCSQQTQNDTNVDAEPESVLVCNSCYALKPIDKANIHLFEEQEDASFMIIGDFSDYKMNDAIKAIEESKYKYQFMNYGYFLDTSVTDIEFADNKIILNEKEYELNPSIIYQENGKIKYSIALEKGLTVEKLDEFYTKVFEEEQLIYKDNPFATE